jgi:two-component system NtrC family response regulator
MRRLSADIERLAPLDTTVLVTGESGTGKELVAEALHNLSRRRRGPFVAVNSATLGAALIESELFGHERGAFTGAVARKLGKLELARGGTLFLDEVGELPLEAQAKLLRAIERKEFQRVGGVETLATDAWLVAATHRDLAAAVGDGEFREDLLYRLRVVELAIPPLRDRREDLPALVAHFLDEVRERVPTPLERFGQEALAALASYPFPGNVRELRNLVERTAIFCPVAEARLEDLPAEVRRGGQESPGAAESALSLAEVERRHIASVLRATGGNKTRAAEILGIDRVTLYARIRKYGL